MRRSLAVFFIVSFLYAHAQDENLTHSLGKKQSVKPSSTTMLVSGIEIGSIPSINTVSNDSSQTSTYTGVCLNYQHKSNFGLEVNSYALLAGSNPGFYLTCVSPYYSNYSVKSFHTFPTHVISITAIQACRILPFKMIFTHA